MKRAELLSIIMHDIGLPVIQGIVEVALDKPEEKVVDDVTQLLKKTIDNAEEIKGMLDLLEDEEQDISVRLNLATLSCHIIASYYNKTGRLPTEAELKKSVSSVDLLLTFSENYIPMDRLDGVFPEHIRGLSPLSRTVANLVYLKYYVPLVDAVAEFSFGQAETKMIQNVSEKLQSVASDLTIQLMGDNIPQYEQKSSELLILSSLIPLYCSCHNKEKDRIMKLSDGDRSEESSDAQIDNIWKIFDKRMSMLTLLAQNIMPGHFSDSEIEKIENLFTDDAGFVDIDDIMAEVGEDSERSRPLRPNKKTRKRKGDGPMGFYADDSDLPDEDNEDGGDSDSGGEHPMAFFKN